jgi:cytoskeletal protein CcmA (bactofilin family)
MPASLPDKVQVACPLCGHSQAEPRAAISTNCRECGGHICVQDTLKPARKRAGRTPERRRVACFDCGTELEVAVTAESTMCKRCSSYVDLKDYRITNAVSKNFKTKGEFVVGPKGFVFNTEAIVGDAVIKGKFLGKLVAERSLTIYSTAEIKGNFKAGRLIIPVENHFYWKEPIKVFTAEIAGELANDLHADGVVLLKSTARLFGDIEAGDLVVELGAIFVGKASVGVKTAAERQTSASV